ncbi:KUP/HAK/KT family potassium transporter, partial [Shewanella sp. A25]|nr:KUP/HAK/KT family potassium transporter [Shewanella shenzhenensis]
GLADSGTKVAIVDDERLERLSGHLKNLPALEKVYVARLREAPGAGHLLAPYVLPISAGILVGLFLVQSRGTASVARFFGPITAVWFLVLAGL